MNTDNDPNNDHGSGPAVERQSTHTKAKAAGRVENMRRINREGLAGPGGRPITKGDYALAARYKAGVSPDNPIFPLIMQHRDSFLADKGGEANVSNLVKEACGHLGFLAVLHRMHLDIFGGAKRLTRREFLEASQSATRVATTFAQIAKQLGFDRTIKYADKTIVIRRQYGEAPAPAQPSNEDPVLSTGETRQEK